MSPVEPPSSPWPRVVLAGAIAFTLAAFWLFIPWSPFLIAAAAYFALPPLYRTRSNASLIGWSVGFALVILGQALRIAR